MSWSYRVMRHETKDGPYYAIHEVFDTDGKLGWTEDPVDVGGESIEDLRWSLEHMLLSLDKPVMDYGVEYKDESK